MWVDCSYCLQHFTQLKHILDWHWTKRQPLCNLIFTFIIIIKRELNWVNIIYKGKLKNHSHFLSSVFVHNVYQWLESYHQWGLLHYKKITHESIILIIEKVPWKSTSSQTLYSGIFFKLWNRSFFPQLSTKLIGWFCI